MDMQKAIETIVEWMKEEGITQDELAKRAGYSASQVSRILNLQRNPSVEFISDVAEALGHSREEILRIANYLPYEKEKDAWVSRMMFLLENLPGPSRETIETLIHALAEKEKRNRHRKEQQRQK